MQKTKDISCSLEHYRRIRETKEYRHTPLAFMEYLLKDNRISQTSKLAWITLSNYSVYVRDFKVRMSPKVLGTKIGKGKETARRALVELETYGYIKTDLSTKGPHVATIWVRFPEQAVQKILQEPDRSASKRSVFKLVPRTAAPQPAMSKFEEPPIPDLEPVQDLELYQVQQLQHEPQATKPKPSPMEPIKTSQEQPLKEPQPISAAPAAQNCGEGGSKTSHINTINTNHDLKKTVNNVSTNLGSTNTPNEKLVRKLLFVDCLFKKFIERANELKTQNLEPSELKNQLWKPYNTWERQVIERMLTLQNTQPIDIPTALEARTLYTQVYEQAKDSGLSPRQACVAAERELTIEQVILKNNLQWVIGRLIDVLEPSNVTPETFEISLKPEKTLSTPVLPQRSGVVINFKPMPTQVCVSQGRADKIVARLSQIAERGELKGEAAQTKLKELAEQLVFHTEHWAPSTLQYSNDDERINIAVNVALKRMKDGSWKAPHGWIRMTIVERELEAQRWKELERNVG